MEKPWWIAYPDGQKFNMSNEEIEREIRAGKFPPTLMGSYQDGPYVPLHQSPNFRREFDAVAARAAAAQPPVWFNFVPALLILIGVGGLLLFIFIGGIAMIGSSSRADEPSKTVNVPAENGWENPKIERQAISIGDEVFLRSDNARIGVIKDIRSEHLFPDGSIQEGVCVRLYSTGRLDWWPRRAIDIAYNVVPPKKKGK